MKKETTNRLRWRVTVTCAVALLVAGCGQEPQDIHPTHQKEIQVTTTPNDRPEGKLPGPGGGVIMQAFYWDVPAGGTWWNTVNSKITSWDAAGFSAVWLPPASKAQNGAFSMGYDPFDYFDFGNYNQMGSTETRFGSRVELETLITNARNKNIQVYADIVVNHNSGGASEFNPYTGGNTWTKFNPASGKFPRTYLDFHPNDVKAYDEGAFGGFPDLSHVKTNVKNWLWIRTDGVGKYYKNTMRFDGWRFDYVKGFGAWVVRDWVNNVGGFTVGENWDGNATVLKSWVDATNRTASAFDFAAYYRMDEAFDGNNLNKLNEDMLWKKDPTKAVTFVANHDTDQIWEKMLAYAYIMTHEGYPCVFYRDYEEWLNKERLNNLIWIHRNLAVGNTTILHVDNDEYVARRNGSPGLVVYINDSDYWQERWIQTNWVNTVIKDYTGHSGWYPLTQGDRWVKIQAPPHSYSVWSPN
jgi:alpha-amylase